MVEITVYRHLLTIVPALNRAIYFIGNRHDTSEFWTEMYDSLVIIRNHIRKIGQMLVHRWGKNTLKNRLNGKKR